MGQIQGRDDGNGGRIMGFRVNRATVQVYTATPKIVSPLYYKGETENRATVLYITRSRGYRGVGDWGG